MRRRQFTHFAAGGLLLSACTENSPVVATGARDLDDVVDWIIETDTDDVIGRASAELAAGLPVQTLLAAILVAGYRHLPLFPVGFLLHPVFLVHPALQVSRAMPLDRSLVPIFWLLWQLRYEIDQMSDQDRENTLPPLDAESVPSGPDAIGAFRAAMAAGEMEAADAAVVGILRARSTSELLDELWPWICRDLLPIGHQAIAGAQVLRAIEAVGWEHAEDPLRGLVRGFFESDANSETLVDFDANLARIAEVDVDWEAGVDDAAAMRDVAAAAIEGSSDDAVRAVLDAIGRGVGPRSLFDGLLIAGGDLLIRHFDADGVFPGLHAVTNANAFRTIARRAGSRDTRLLALLQQAAFLPRDRAEAEDRTGGAGREDRLLTLERASASATLDEAFDALGDRVDAAKKALAWLDDGGALPDLAAQLYAVALVKADEEHDYKFPVAVIEELDHVTPEALPSLVATVMLYGKTPTDTDGRAYASAAEEAAKLTGGG